MIEKYLTTPHDRLRFVRESLQLTQIEMALILGIKRCQYNRYEKANRGIPIDVVARLSIYGINPGFLFGIEKMIIDNWNINEIKIAIFNKLNTLSSPLVTTKETIQ